MTCQRRIGRGVPLPRPSRGTLKPTHLRPICPARPHLVLASRVFGLLSNGLGLAPSLSPTAQITRGCLALSAIWGCGVARRGRAASHIESLFIDLFSSFRPCRTHHALARGRK